MKHTFLLAFLLLIVQSTVILAHSDKEFKSLCEKASVSQKSDDYILVCDYCYANEMPLDIFAAYLDSARTKSFAEKSKLNQAKYYMLYAEYAYLQDSLPIYKAYKEKALGLFERLKDDEHIVSCCSELGYYYNVVTKYDSARYYLNKGLQTLDRKSQKGEDYMIMLTNMASSYLYEGITDSALVYANRAYEQSVLLRDSTVMVENLNQLGVLYRRQGELSKSISNYEAALELCEAMGRLNAVPTLYANIATLYSDLDRSQDAINFSRRALEYALKSKSRDLIGFSYYNLGSVLIPAGYHQEAIDTLRKAVTICSELGNKRSLFSAYMYMTSAFMKSGQVDSAKVYQQKLDMIFNESAAGLPLQIYYQTKSSVLMATKDYQGAIPIYKELIRLYGIYPQDTKKYGAYHGLAQSYNRIAQYKDAYIYLDSAFVLRDSVFKHEIEKQLSEFSVKYQTKEKELELVKLRQAKLMHEAEVMKQRIRFLVILVCLIILVLVLLYSRQRQKVKSNLLAHYAKEKEREFTELQKDTELRLTRNYIDGLESERERLSKELHDGVCNNLLALEMNLKKLPDESQQLKSSLHLLTETRESVRNVSHELMPPAFQYATIDEMLLDYTSRLSETNGISIYYDSTEETDWTVVSQQAGYEIYRIVQEALNNSIKHASTSSITVSLILQGDMLKVIVSDDGIGFDINKKHKGIGLRTIAERVKSIGGELQVKTGAGGTVITVVINGKEQDAE